MMVTALRHGFNGCELWLTLTAPDGGEFFRGGTAVVAAEGFQIRIQPPDLVSLLLIYYLTTSTYTLT